MAQAFETKTCSRCGGSGHYSYCQMHGTTCFGCGGSGLMLTKRGKAAAALYRRLLTVKAKDVKPGMWLVADGVPGISKTKAYKVETAFLDLDAPRAKSLKDGVWVEAPPYFKIEGVDAAGERHGLHTFEDYDVRIAPTKAERAAAIAKAQAFQATLTKTGAPMKRKATAYG